MVVSSARRMHVESWRRPEKPDRKKPALLQIKLPNPAQIGVPKQLLSTLRM